MLAHGPEAGDGEQLDQDVAALWEEMMDLAVGRLRDGVVGPEGGSAAEENREDHRGGAVARHEFLGLAR